MNEWEIAMHALSDLTLTSAAAIGWFYMVTNATRVITYLPQIVAVWRSPDGAQAISLLTWGSWLVANVGAILYGTLVVHDWFFVLISVINFCGCACVTFVAAWRRMQWRERLRVHAIPRPLRAIQLAKPHASQATSMS